jgi:hypothetical protein
MASLPEAGAGLLAKKCTERQVRLLRGEALERREVKPKRRRR